MPPRRTPPRPDEASAGASASPTTTNGPNLQFISSEIACVPKLDISTCTPDGFQIWKQRRNSAVTITAFAGLPRGTQQALFTNVLSDDSVKRMNILGLQDVNAIIEAFQIQVCGSSSIMDTSFTTGLKGQTSLLKKLHTDLQTQLNKCHYEDCCKTETKMSCKERILVARLVAGIRSSEVRNSLLCIRDLTLEKAVQHVQVDKVTSFQANQFSSQINKTATSANQQNKSDNRNRNNETLSDSQENNPKKCKFCMRVHVFRKELCPARDSICKACKTKGH